MFRDWDSFYLLVGGAGGSLIGLLFVVVTLTQDFETRKATRGASVYMTPTVFHFGVCLTLAAMAVAPGLPPWAAALIVGAAALMGLAYSAWVGVRIRSPDLPEPPHWTDFWCYSAIPFGVYVALGAAAVAVWALQPWAAHGVAGVLIGLLIAGIRNAWDLVTWLAPRAKPDPQAPTSHPPASD